MEPNQTDYKKIAKHCNLWRNYGDIDDSYAVMHNIADHFGKQQDTFSANAGIGAWNDPGKNYTILLKPFNLLKSDFLQTCC